MKNRFILSRYNRRNGIMLAKVYFIALNVTSSKAIDINDSSNTLMLHNKCIKIINHWWSIGLTLWAHKNNHLSYLLFSTKQSIIIINFANLQKNKVSWGTLDTYWYPQLHEFHLHLLLYRRVHSQIDIIWTWGNSFISSVICDLICKENNDT